MGKRDGQQPGPQQHAEGQHGARTHARFLEQIHRGLTSDDLAVQAGVDEPGVERVEGPRSSGDEPPGDDVDENSGRDRQRR
ncbi:MAG TPA: hypothetical protein VGP25_20810 [Gemmatimonadaceae bacterium]|jgi:hypothetical protein|nr:hypothetical protein [Gemmatimonadaceae bacterium]